MSAQKAEGPLSVETKKGLTLGKGKLPEEGPEQAKPTLKPPVLITPEVVHIFVINDTFHILMHIL